MGNGMLGSTEDNRGARQWAEPFDALTARVRGAFETMADATRSLPRIDRGIAQQHRLPIARLIGCAQHHDAFDQRMSHIGEARGRCPVLADGERAAAETVIALQLVDLSTLLERAASDAGAAFRAILEAVETAEVDGGDAGQTARAVSEVGRQGLRAAADLSAASDVMATEAHAHAAMVDRSVEPEVLRGADLGWMLALYTMDDERRVHRMAIAQACGE